MTRNDILSNPILANIYNDLIEGCKYSNQAAKIKHQAIEIIKQLLLHRLFEHYKTPKFFYFALTDNIKDKLRKCIIQKHERLGRTISDEELEEAIKNMVEAADMLVTQQIEKAEKNG